MENKDTKDRNSLIYLSTIIVVIIVYLVIYLFGMAVRRSIYQDSSSYEHNLPKQPVNNIISVDDECSHDNGNNNQNNNGNNNHCKKDKDKIVFEYDYNEGNYIYLINQFPTSDEDGMNFVGDKYTQDFKLKFNENARGVSYTITAEKLEESDLEDDWIKLYLEADGEGIANCFRENGRIKTFNEYLNYSTSDNEKVLYHGVVSAEEARRGHKDFTYRMWISEDVMVNNEEYPIKTIKVKINVYAEK